VWPDRRVAHEHVDGPQLGETFLHHGVDGAGIRDVAEHGHRAHPSLATLRGHTLELFAIGARVQHEIRALGGEGERDGTPDIAAGSRDERLLAREPHVVYSR
jgi:hypothetical protein